MAVNKAVFTGLNGLRWDEMQFANNNPMFELHDAFVHQLEISMAEFGLTKW